MTTAGKRVSRIARDVTDKHLAQQALKESQTCAVELSETSRRAEQRYRAFLNFLPEPVFVFNLDQHGLLSEPCL